MHAPEVHLKPQSSQWGLFELASGKFVSSQRGQQVERVMGIEPT
jgi:hypothetical protein